MHAVVSLLDDAYYTLVEKLWAELEKTFGLQGVYVTPYPHFTYQVAQQYDLTKLEPILEQFAKTQSSFTVRTTGLGLFTGGYPVLYIPVIRDANLTNLHENLWPEVSKAGAGIEEYYRPAQWLPHISLCFGDVDNNTLAEAVRLLGERDFNWEIPINNLALIYDTGAQQELRSRFNFSG